MTCPNCGSWDPRLTIGSPVCVNDEFHQDGEYTPRVERIRRFVRHHRRLVLLSFGFLCAAAVMFAGVAKADVNDDTFLQVISEHGITYPSDEYAINGGHAICDALNQGYPELKVAAMIDQQSGLGPSDSGYLVGAAEAAYCPWVIGDDGPQIDDSGPLKHLV